MKRWVALLAALSVASAAQAAFIIEIDTDGADDGVLTFNPLFSFGGDTTTASQSAASGAVGMTGGDSIFGGDGSAEPDTYLFNYMPSVNGDNLPLAPGTALNASGDEDAGLAAGGSGAYDVYATWPFTSNVSGGLTTFTLSDGVGDLFTVDIDQNGGGAGTGNEWIFLGTAILDADTSYTLSQEAGANTFVSMRSAGVLFTAIPEPSALALLAIGGVVALRRRR